MRCKDAIKASNREWKFQCTAHAEREVFEVLRGTLDCFCNHGLAEIQPNRFPWGNNRSQQAEKVFRRPAHRRRHHHQPAAERQRAPDLPDGEVEGVRVEHRPHVAVVEPERALRVREQLHHVAVRELPGWRLIRHKGGEIAFFQEHFDAVAQANATCRDDAEAASLEVLMRHLLIGYTDVQVHQNERVPLDGREALHDVVAARLDGVPVMLDLYVLKRNGCIFDLSLAAPPGRYPSVQRDFEGFVAGFRQEGRS